MKQLRDYCNQKKRKEANLEFSEVEFLSVKKRLRAKRNEEAKKKNKNALLRLRDKASC